MTRAIHGKRLGLGGLAASTALGFCLSATAAEVTHQRLLNAASEPQNWLMTYRTFDAHRNSSLIQINRTNVGNLRPKFMVGLGTPTGAGVPLGHSTPLVDEGMMYATTGRSEVIKIDVRNGNRGTVLWRYDPKVEGTYLRNRGVALLGTSVYLTTSDKARMIKLDRDSGEPQWEINTVSGDFANLQRHTASPLAVKDMIVIGQSNGDSGARGWVSAFKAAKGERAWTFHVIPEPGEPGHETWADGHDAWKTGGGAIWATPSYDPETNLLIVGTGNPVPFTDPQWRPGDNLYTNSAVALDADTGKLKWFFQEIPNESWDYDTVNMRMLYDVDVGGRKRKLAGNFSRNGVFYTMDRTTGEFLFGEPYTKVTWTAGLDPKTGKPLEYVPGGKALQDYGDKAIKYGKKETTGRNVCPHYMGGPTYSPPVYDASRMVAYVSGSEFCADAFNTRPGDPNTKVLGAGNIVATTAPVGYIYGADVRTGKVVKALHTPLPIYSGLLGTAGDLIFIGHLDGKFSAYDKDTLSELWSYNTGITISAPPITYVVDGKQYVAVTTGGRDRDIAAFTVPEMKNTMSGISVLLVFGL